MVLAFMALLNAAVMSLSAATPVAPPSGLTSLTKTADAAHAGTAIITVATTAAASIPTDTVAVLNELVFAIVALPFLAMG